MKDIKINNLHHERDHWRHESHKTQQMKTGKRTERKEAESKILSSKI